MNCSLLTSPRPLATLPGHFILPQRPTPGPSPPQPSADLDVGTPLGTAPSRQALSSPEVRPGHVRPGGHLRFGMATASSGTTGGLVIGDPGGPFREPNQRLEEMWRAGRRSTRAAMRSAPRHSAATT